MNENQRLMGVLLSAAIHDQKINETIANADWGEIFSLAEKHQLQSLLYSVVKDIQKESGGPDDVMMNSWRNISFMSAMIESNNAENVYKVMAAFSEAEIPFVVLKGLVIRDLYPRSEFRTMSDADFLIKEEHIELAQAILKQFGYNEEERSYKHIQYTHEKQLSVELHTKLLDEQFSVKTEKWEKDLWESITPVKINGVSMMTLSPQDHLLFLCFHMIVHFMLSGFGLRQLCDLVVFIEKNQDQIDWAVFIKSTKELVIYDFVSVMFSVCERIFGSKMPDLISDHIENEHNLNLIINDIYTGGVFGYSESSHIVSGILANYIGNNKTIPNKFIRILNLIFPSFRIMRNKYKFVANYPILIPLAWIHRFIYNLFRKDKLFKKKSEYIAFFRSHSTFEERYKLYHWLGLL